MQERRRDSNLKAASETDTWEVMKIVRKIFAMSAWKEVEEKLEKFTVNWVQARQVMTVMHSHNLSFVNRWQRKTCKAVHFFLACVDSWQMLAKILHFIGSEASL